MTPRLFVVQVEGLIEYARRQSDLAISSAWISGMIARAAKPPPLSALVGQKRPARSREEASLELQAQMRVTREHMVKSGRVRSWKEWQAGS